MTVVRNWSEAYLVRVDDDSDIDAVLDYIIDLYSCNIVDVNRDENEILVETGCMTSAQIKRHPSVVDVVGMI